MKKDFRGEARSRLSDAPESLEEFLGEETGNTESRQDVKPEEVQVKQEVSVGQRTERYEWRHTPEMAGKLQRLLLERNQQRPSGTRKIKMVDLIDEAVEGLLEQYIIKN